MSFPFQVSLRRLVEFSTEEIREKVLQGNYRRALLYQHQNISFSESMRGFLAHFRQHAPGLALSLYLMLKLGMFQNWTSDYRAYPYNANEKFFNYAL